MARNAATSSQRMKVFPRTENGNLRLILFSHYGLRAIRYSSIFSLFGQSDALNNSSCPGSGPSGSNIGPRTPLQKQTREGYDGPKTNSIGADNLVDASHLPESEAATLGDANAAVQIARARWGHCSAQYCTGCAQRVCSSMAIGKRRVRLLVTWGQLDG